MTEDERDAALVEIQPRMRAIAGKVRRQHGGRPELDDLISAGNLAALRAVERWDPAGGASLATWLLNRAHFAMTDHLRRTPGWSRYKGQIAEFVPMDREIDGQRVEWLRDPGQSVEQQMISDERVQRLKDAVTELPDGKHRQVLELVLAGKTHKEAAEVVGYSNGRVAQIIAQYAGRLQRRIEKPPLIVEKSAVPQPEPKPVAVIPRPPRSKPTQGIEGVLVQMAIEKLIAYIDADPARWARECTEVLRRAA